jgi:hypothetical protein
VNRYLFLHRIKGPVMILIFGVTALLDQWHLLSYGRSWPLYLIALGVLQLAERAAWAQAQSEVPPPGVYAGNQPGYQGSYTGQPGGWSGQSSAEPGSTPQTVTPPDMPRGTDREEK